MFVFCSQFVKRSIRMAGSGNPTNLTGQPAGAHTDTFVVRGTSVNGGTYINLVEGIFTARPYVDARDSSNLPSCHSKRLC